MYVEMTYDSISHIKIRNTWYTVANVQYLTDVQIGRTRPNSFLYDFALDGWILIETSENELLYFPVKDITGIKSSATPLGG